MRFKVWTEIDSFSVGQVRSVAHLDVGTGQTPSVAEAIMQVARKAVKDTKPCKRVTELKPTGIVRVQLDDGGKYKVDIYTRTIEPDE